MVLYVGSFLCLSLDADQGLRNCSSRIVSERQNGFCPSPDSASLVGAFVLKYPKIIKST